MAYKERAFFYNSEISIEKDLPFFLERLKNIYNLNSVILLPCGAGKYKELFIKYFQKSYFLDIEDNMLKNIRNGLKKDEKNKIIPIKHDMREELYIKTDAILCLNQGMQFITLEEFEIFLTRVATITKYVILDLFDFNGDFSDFLSYYNKKNKRQTMVFYYNGIKVTRSTEYKLDNDGINIVYSYDKLFGENQIYLYNYDYQKVIKLIRKLQLYKIKSIYENLSFKRYTKSNRFIIVLEVINDAR